MSRIDILCACDPRYAQHAGVMLNSLCRNNPDHALNVTIVADGLSPRQMRDFDFLLAYPNFRCRIVEPAERLRSAVARKKTSHHLTASAYYRILVDELLEEQVDRVLYLDCDVIVTGSIAELYGTQLGGKLVGAAADAIGAERYAVLGLPSAADYFNSGVLLIDVGEWRRRGISRRVLDFASEHADKIVWADQDALNAVLHRDWLRLDERWNWLVLGNQASQRTGAAGERVMPPETPRIIHFNGNLKPWLAECPHPYRDLYVTYLAGTPWQGFRPSSRLWRKLRNSWTKRASKLGRMLAVGRPA
jgi:lipopolysaccharide biosynthesis glycosyltransferase